MFTTNYTFQYNPENLQVFSYIFDINAPFVSLVILWIVILYGCIYILAPYIYSFFVARSEEHEKKLKHNVIRDLILMKEIQGELEKEIEQSLLNITLQWNDI